MIQRRAFLTGLASAFAAPTIVRAASLMPVRGIVVPRFTIEPGVFYGRSPAMDALDDYRSLWRIEWQAAAELIYPRSGLIRS